MKPLMSLAALLLLSQTGCVAAIPLAMQLATSANSAAQLCSMAKVPGQATSLCDQLSLNAMSQPQAKPVSAPVARR